MINVVTFPGLGLEFTLDRVAFHLFGRPIFWYGIIIASGMLLAVYLCSRWAPRFGIVPDHILDLMFFAVPAALVAVRAYYVIFNLDLYRQGDGSLDWGAILRYSDGGLAIYGAIISSVIVLLIFCKVRKVSFLAFADLGVHGLFIGQLIGRWGNFMNVEAFGSTTTLPWRMCGTSIAEYLLQSGYVDQAGYEAVLSGALGVHPTFFYESMWNLAGLFLVYQLGKRWRKYDGECFLFYLCWYGLGRAWIEGLRTDSLYLFNWELFGQRIRVSQALSIVMVAVAAFMLFYNIRIKKRSPESLWVHQVAAEKARLAAAEAEDAVLAETLMNEVPTEGEAADPLETEAVEPPDAETVPDTETQEKPEKGETHGNEN